MKLISILTALIFSCLLGFSVYAEESSEESSLPEIIQKSAPVLLIDNAHIYEHMQQTAQLFGELREQGRTILVVTHDSELIEACCTNIMRLE